MDNTDIYRLAMDMRSYVSPGKTVTDIYARLLTASEEELMYFRKKTDESIKEMVLVREGDLK